MTMKYIIITVYSELPTNWDQDYKNSKYLHIYYRVNLLHNTVPTINK